MPLDVDALSPADVELLFRTFSRRFGSRWDRTFEDDKARALWRRDLVALGVTDALLKVGLRRSVTFSWPPSPAEFAALCVLEGLPDWEEAYRLASESRWAHPVVYEAARRVGVYELRSLPESRTRGAFEKAFKAVCSAWARGERFEVPVVPALPQVPNSASREEALEHLRRIKAMLAQR